MHVGSAAAGRERAGSERERAARAPARRYRDQAQRSGGGAPLGLGHAVHVPAARGALQVLRASPLSARPVSAKDRAAGRWAAGQRPGATIGAVFAATRRRAAVAAPSAAPRAASVRRLRSTAPLRRRVCCSGQERRAPSGRKIGSTPCGTRPWHAPRARARCGAPARAASPARGQQRTKAQRPWLRNGGCSVDATRQNRRRTRARCTPLAGCAWYHTACAAACCPASRAAEALARAISPANGSAADPPSARRDASARLCLQMGRGTRVSAPPAASRDAGAAMWNTRAPSSVALLRPARWPLSRGREIRGRHALRRSATLRRGFAHLQLVQPERAC